MDNSISTIEMKGDNTTYWLICDYCRDQFSSKTYPAKHGCIAEQDAMYKKELSKIDKSYDNYYLNSYLTDNVTTNNFSPFRNVSSASYWFVDDDPFTQKIENKKVSAFDRQVNGSHYKDMVIQPVEFIVKNKIPFLEANAIKYICRHKAKGGITDLEKAKHYIEMAIEEYYGKKTS